MEIANFGLEKWLNKWEKEAKCDLSQSSMDTLTLEELVGLDGTSIKYFFERVDKWPLDYGWIEGSDEFTTLVAKLYQHVEPVNILQTNGAIGANLLALYALIEPGDRSFHDAELPTAL